MATRCLPVTHILLFLITVYHQTYSVYIHINVRVKLWSRNIKSSNIGINKFMLLLQCVMTSFQHIVQELPFGLI